MDILKYKKKNLFWLAFVWLFCAAFTEVQRSSIELIFEKMVYMDDTKYNRFEIEYSKEGSVTTQITETISLDGRCEKDWLAQYLITGSKKSLEIIDTLRLEGSCSDQEGLGFAVNIFEKNPNTKSTMSTLVQELDLVDNAGDEIRLAGPPSALVYCLFFSLDRISGDCSDLSSFQRSVDQLRLQVTIDSNLKYIKSIALYQSEPVQARWLVDLAPSYSISYKYHDGTVFPEAYEESFDSTTLLFLKTRYIVV